MNKDASFDELVEIIRECQGFSVHDEISADMLLERDLGISGDDGWELLEAIEHRFGMSFVGEDGTIRESFKLAENESVFHDEVSPLFGFIGALFGKEQKKVKPLTVGQLYEVVSISQHGNSNQTNQG